MPLFLVTSVCNDGVDRANFRLVEAESREAIAAHMLARPYEWEGFLWKTKLWWELTYYPYKYDKPRGWSAAEFLAEIGRTHVDGDSKNQLRIHPADEVLRLPPPPRTDPIP